MMPYSCYLLPFNVVLETFDSDDNDDDDDDEGA